MSRPFFASNETTNAVERLADSNALTVVVGAGSSMEVGFPSWNGLVDSLLHRVGRNMRVPEDSPHAQDGLTAFCRALVDAYGTVGAGAVATAVLGDDLQQHVREAIYRWGDHVPSPGFTAIGVARLKRVFGPRCEVVTTNYDRLLEAAMVNEGVPGVRTLWTSRPSRGATVRHLHGVLTPTGLQGSLILSEADYHGMQQPSVWQEQYMGDRLRSSTCLFIGTSLTDPNLLRYLYRTRGRKQHVAVFVRQADKLATRPDLQRGVLRARDKAALARWQAVHVQPLRADFYFQSAQFVHEVARLRAQGANYVPYVDRLQEWERVMRTGLMQARSRARFLETQDRLHTWLARFTQGVHGLLERSGTTQGRELIELSLWARSPRDRGLVCIGSSDRKWTHASAMKAVPIETPSIYVAVDAFCRGRIMYRQIPPDWPTRWRSVTGIPIYLDQEPWGRLPVGAITLASDRSLPETGMPETGVHLLRPRLFDQLAGLLARGGRLLLTP